MTRTTPALALALASALLLQGESRAVTLFEPFTDGALVGGSDNSGIGWYRRSSNQATAIVPDPTFGNALQLSITNSTQINRALIGTFAPISLTNVGDQISLSFDFRFEIAPTVNTADGFRFGFYNSKETGFGSPTAAAFQSDDDFGYQASIGTGTTAGFNIFKETNADTGGLGADEPTIDRVSLNPTGVSTSAIGDTLKHTVTLTLTKTAAGLSFSASVDGNLLGTAIDNNAPFLKFDELVINHATPQGYVIDNVTVTTEAIPEPATAGLLGLGLVGLLSRRRR